MGWKDSEKLPDLGEPSPFKGKAVSVSPPTTDPVSFSYSYHIFASEFIFRATAQLWSAHMAYTKALHSILSTKI